MDHISYVDRISSSQPVKPIQQDYQFSNKLDVSEQTQRHYDEAEEPLAKEDILEAVKLANQHVVEVNTQLEYQIHEETDRILVKLVDRETNEVIREIPPEKMLDLVANVWKSVGMLIDEHK